MLRLHHDAIHTERAALEGIVRDVRVHRRRSRDARCPPAPNLEAFLTALAVHGQGVAATHPQAMTALGALDTRVLNHAMQGRLNAGAPTRRATFPWS